MSKKAQFSLLFLIILLMLDLYMNFGPVTNLWFKIILHALFLVYLVYYVSFVYKNKIVDHLSLSTLTKNWSTGFYAITVLIICIELVFTFVTQSHVNGHTYGNRNWMGYYWKTDSLGFRNDIPLNKHPESKTILVLGDSFTAGQGLKNIYDRYTNVLQGFISGSHQVFNLGVNGHDTEDELNTLLSFPVKPDIVIVQYSGNDIAKEGLKYGIRPNHFNPNDGISLPIWGLTRISYLFNYIFWYHYYKGEVMYNDYIDFLKNCHANPKVIKAHTDDLYAFKNYCHSNQIPLLVVIFPFMDNIPLSEFYIKSISQFLTNESIPFLDVSPVVNEIPVDQRHANRWDPHPGIVVHEKVGKKIFHTMIDYKMIRSESL